ncbi:MAG TPA: phage baseplate assembly protein V, partial [Longimicrobiaceae bacterium]|nr:phage baseplate assembly protein V [Longimicrobiaceae bacterium]
MEMEQLVGRLAEESERRFYGKYRGFVVDNDDPEQLGRLRLVVPSVLGPEVVTGWAAACVPYGGAAGMGTLFVPEVDAGVWVEFEEGDLEFPVWVG